MVRPQVGGALVVVNVSSPSTTEQEQMGGDPLAVTSRTSSHGDGS